MNRTVVAHPTGPRRTRGENLALRRRRLLTEVAPLAWREDALCAQTDPEAFFPEQGSSPRPAKVVCDACPVRVDCLEHALANDELYGVWGGLSPRARGELRRKRAAAERGVA